MIFILFLLFNFGFYKFSEKRGKERLEIHCSAKLLAKCESPSSEGRYLHNHVRRSDSGDVRGGKERGHGWMLKAESADITDHTRAYAIRPYQSVTAYYNTNVVQRVVGAF